MSALCQMGLVLSLIAAVAVIIVVQLGRSDVNTRVAVSMSAGCIMVLIACMMTNKCLATDNKS
jgi:hypothetical protein